MYSYKTAILIEKGYDFSLVYGQAQEQLNALQGFKFTLPEVVSFLKVQSKDFTVELPSLVEKDESIAKLVDTYHIESNTISPFYEEPVPEPAPIPVKSESVLKLEKEISTLNDLIDMEDDENEIIKYKNEIKVLEELIELENESESTPPTPEPKPHTYKLGDKYRSDFDYDGMLKFGSEANIHMGLDTLTKLHTSFESVNYATLATILWDAIQRLKEGRELQADKGMNKFNRASKKAMQEFGNGGGVDKDVPSYMVKLGELLAKYKPYFIGIHDSEVVAKRPNESYQVLSPDFKGFGDRTDIKNIVWRSLADKNSSELIKKVTKGKYEFYKPTWSDDVSNFKFIKVGYKYEDGGGVEEKNEVINSCGCDDEKYASGGGIKDALDISLFTYNKDTKNFTTEVSDTKGALHGGEKVVIIQNPVTGKYVTFDFISSDKDGSNEDTYGWRYENKEKGLKLLVIND